MDGRREGGPEEDGCHELEDTCTQKRLLEDGREGGQGPTRTVEPWSSSKMSLICRCRDSFGTYRNTEDMTNLASQIGVAINQMYDC